MATHRHALFALLATTVWTAPVLGADCDNDGVPDAEEIAAGAEVDCNGNGIPDACDLSPQAVRFEEETVRQIDDWLWALVAHDFDDDGFLDIGALSSNPQNVGQHRPQFTVYRNNGDGTFSEEGVAQTLVEDGGSKFATFADLDGDGDLDAALITEAARGLNVYRDIGKPTVQLWQRFPSTSRGVSIHATRLHADGMPALLVFYPSPPVLQVLRNLGPDAGFASATVTQIADTTRHITPIDLDGDGIAELAGSTQEPPGVTVYRLGELGVPSAIGFFPSPSAPSTLTTFDLDDDDDLDLGASIDRNLWVFANDGTGQLSARLAGTTAFDIMVGGDFNGDGRLDVAARTLGGSVCLTSTVVVRAFLARGDGSLEASPETDFAFGGLHFAAADFDRDGIDEILSGRTVTPGRSHVVVSRALASARSADCDGNATPDECELADNDCNWNGTPDHCDIASGASADCDGDGAPDECQPDCDGNGAPDTCDIARDPARDADGDGRLDACELAPPLPPIRDCNGNDIDDATEIATGAATDCDENGVLDACDLLPPIRFRNNERLFSPLPLDVARLASGDLDGDGLADVALGEYDGCCTDGAPAGIRIAMNRGEGRFEVVDRVTTHGSIVDIDIADVDLDGRPDLVVASGSRGCEAAGGALSVYPVRSDGTLGRPWLRDDVQPIAMSLGDADGDGDLDAAIAESGIDSSRVLVLRNDGGRFETASTIEIAGGALLPLYPLRLSDLDGDGDGDLAAAYFTESGPSRLWIAWNAGALEFDEPIGVETEPVARIDTADLDGDGDRELIVLHDVLPTKLTIRWNDGSAPFTDIDEVQTPNIAPRDIHLADLDGDDASELVVTGRFNAELSGVDNDGLYVVSGFARGRPPSVTASVVPPSTWSALDELSGDDDPDLLLTSVLPLGLVTLRGIPGVGFEGTLAQLAPLRPNVVAVADFDGDGWIDVVSGARGDFASGRLTFSRNVDGQQVDTLRPLPLDAPPARLVAADFDGDGHADIAVTDASTPRVLVLRGRGDWSFDPPTTLVVPVIPVDLIAADLDGDGLVDLATVGQSQADLGTMSMFASGRKGFSPARNLGIAGNPSSIAAGDIDGDGDLDLVAMHSATRSVSVLENTGLGRFGLTEQLGARGERVNLADVSGDGRADVVVSERGQVAVLLRRAEGGFAEPQSAQSEAEATTVVVDLDGDGAREIVAMGLSGKLIVLRNAGDGSFTELDAVAIQDPDASDEDGGGASDDDTAPVSPFVGLATGDLDRDGRADLVVPIPEASVVRVLLNDTIRRRPDADGNGLPDPCVAPPRDFRRGDANGSGGMDIADVVFVLEYLFRRGAPPVCAKSADADDSGALDIADPVRILGRLFLGRPPLPPPTDACGGDPTDDMLECRRSPGCE